MKLEVGKKYRLAHWFPPDWVTIQHIHGKELWGIRSSGDSDLWDINGKWLPYKEPELDDTKLWYWESRLENGSWEMKPKRYTEADMPHSQFREYRKLKALDFILKEN